MRVIPMLDPIKIWRETQKAEWQTKNGWVIYAFAILLIELILLPLFTKVGIALSLRWIMVVLLGSQLIHWVAWLVIRKYFYGTDILYVAFAITTENNSHYYYREIKKRFKELITTYKLLDDIKIKELPSDINFSNEKFAEAYINKHGIRLLVWGNTSEGNLNSVPSSKFNIKLSYQYKKSDNKQQKEIVDNIRVAVQRNIWSINSSESMIQLDVVSGNILEISLYTLGVCLATVPNVEFRLKSVDILEKLQVRLNARKQDINFPHLELVKQKTKLILVDEYYSLSRYYWEDKKNSTEAMEYLTKVIRIDENNFNAHQNMSYLKWRSGDDIQARKHADKAWCIQPENPLARLSKAFLLIIDRKYKHGLEQYKKIRNVDDTNIVDVIEFLENEFENNNENNAGLLFAAGWLNIRFADKVRGINQLQSFLDSAESTSAYKVLVTEAQNTLLRQSH